MTQMPATELSEADKLAASLTTSELLELAASIRSMVKLWLVYMQQSAAIFIAFLAATNPRPHLSHQS
jgi:hypothetical protein